MKKLLSILASVTLTASASTAVVSCSTENSTNSADSYVNNNLNNILGASLEKAKSVIINNEYGIDPGQVLRQQKAKKLSADGLSNIDYNDLKNKKNSTVSDLVNKYYGSIDDTNTNSGSGTNVDLGGKNGADGTLDYLLKQVMDTLKVPSIIQNAIFRYKKTILSSFNLTRGLVNMTALNNENSDMYNQAVSGGEYLINTAIKMGLNYLAVEKAKEGTDGGWGTTVTNVLQKVFNAKDTFSDDTLPGFFGSSTMQMVKGVANALLNGQDKDGKATDNAPSPIQNAVYKNTDITLPDFTSSDSTKPPVKLSDYFKQFDTIQSGWESDTLAKVSSADVKKEFLASADRILRTLLNPKVLPGTSAPNSLTDNGGETPATTTDYTSAFVSDLQSVISSLVGGLVSGDIDASSLLNPDLKEDQSGFMGIGWEALRDISLMNAQFSMFEDKYDVDAIDSQHLFGNDENGNPQTNYQYLNGFVNDIKDDKGNVITHAKYPTLGDTPYLEAGDEPINLNYFFSNLNYYLGGLSNGDDDSVYRIQKFLFIVLNDPMKSTMTDGSTSPDPKEWVDKQSDLLDFIIQTGLQAGKSIVDAKDKAAGGSDSTIATVKAALDSITPANVTTVEDDLLKPLILGLINGNSFQPLLEILDGGLHGALQIDSVANLLESLKPYGINIDDIMKTIDRMVANDKVGNDTIHSLFMVDFRKIIKPLKIIPQAWLDKLFGPNLPVNLMTIVNMPLSKILSIIGVSGFEGGKISPIGDFFTLHSIPWLINFMNDKVLNNVEDANRVPEKYAVYPTDGDGKPDDSKAPDFSKSLKARDINLQAIYDLFISIVGSNNSGKYVGKTDNILSRLMHDLIKSDVSGDSPSSWDIELDPSTTVNDLGLMNQVQKKAPQKQSNSVSLADEDPSSIADGKYNDDAKTIEFDDPKIKADWTLDTLGAQYKPTQFTPSDGKIVMTFGKSIEQAKPQDLTFTFDDSKKNKYTGKVTIPAMFGGAGTDLQIQYNSITGSFYRLNLPKIEQDQPDKDGSSTFTMHDEYLNVDFLKTDYDNMINLIDYFDSPGDYLKFIKDILDTQNAFVLDYDPQSIKYFESNRNLIKGLTFTVTYKNYVVGKTNQYIFTVSRESNVEAFKINQLITNKTD